MCYSEPVLTGEDKAWSDGPSDHYDSEVVAPQKPPRKALVSVGVTNCGHSHSVIRRIPCKGLTCALAAYGQLSVGGPVLQASAIAEDTRSPIKPVKRVRMSTSVGMAASESSQPPASAQEQQATKSAGSGAKQSRGKSVALGLFPAEMQRIMQAEGHLEPTPVQIRQALAPATSSFKFIHSGTPV